MIIHIYVYELILCPNSHLGPPARYYLYNFSKYISSCFTISFNLSYDSLYTNVVAAVFRNVLMPKWPPKSQYNKEDHSNKNGWNEAN